MDYAKLAVCIVILGALFAWLVLPFVDYTRRLIAAATRFARDETPDFGDSQPLATAWREFSDHLIRLRPAPNAQPHLPANRPHFRRTCDAAVFFSDDLIYAGWSLRRLQAVPNLLLGAGIFLTFLFLTTGLILSSPGAEGTAAQEHDALRGFLRHVSGAFPGSVMGLLASLGANGFLLYRFDKTRRALAQAAEAANKMFSLATLEQLQFEGNVAVERLQHRLAAAFDSKLEDLKAAQAYSQKLTEATLREQLAALGGLSTKLDISNHSLKNAVDACVLAIQDVLRMWSAEFKAEMRNEILPPFEGITDAIRRVALQVDTIGSNLASAGAALESVVAKTFADAASHAADDYRRQVTDMQNGFRVRAESFLTDIGERLRTSADTAAQELLERFRKTADAESVAAAESWKVSVESACASLVQRAAELTQAWAAASQEGTARLASTSRESSEEFRRVIAEAGASVDQAAALLAKAQTENAGILTEVSAELRDLRAAAPALSRAVTRAGTQMDAVADRLAAAAADSAQNVQKAAQEVLAAAGTFRAATADSSARVSEELKRMEADTLAAGAAGQAALRGAAEQGAVKIGETVELANQRITALNQKSANVIQAEAEALTRWIEGSLALLSARAEKTGDAVARVDRAMEDIAIGPLAAMKSSVADFLDVLRGTASAATALAETERAGASEIAQSVAALQSDVASCAEALHSLTASTRSATIVFSPPAAGPASGAAIQPGDPAKTELAPPSEAPELELRPDVVEPAVTQEA